MPNLPQVASSSKRRGNPDWGKPMPPPKAGLTEFEKVVKRLRLSVPEFDHSAALKDWVRRNHNQRYVPAELLKAWGVKVAND